MPRGRFPAPTLTLAALVVAVVACDTVTVEDERADLITAHAAVANAASLAERLTLRFDAVWRQSVEAKLLDKDELADSLASVESLSDLVATKISESTTLLGDATPKSPELTTAHAILEEYLFEARGLYLMVATVDVRESRFDINSYLSFRAAVRERRPRLRTLEARWRLEVGL